MNFNQKIWNICRKIPKGRVATYKAIAIKLKTKAYHAVGNALNKNPYSPKVPCHRVVRSNGEVGGFAKGVKEKIKMLEKEGIAIKNGKIVDFEKKAYRL